MPSTSISQIAERNAHATWVPIPKARARRYMRNHHSSTELVRKNPAISHHPPSCRRGKCRPFAGAGGSSASHGSCRMNCIGIPVHRGEHVEPDDLESDEAADQRQQSGRAQVDGPYLRIAEAAQADG